MVVTLADGLQIGGLVVNAGLLCGLILQIRHGTTGRREDLRLAALVRREDLDTARRLSTIEAWARVVEAITAAELSTRVYLGRGVIKPTRVSEFIAQLKAASGRSEEGLDPVIGDDQVITANEHLRSVVNTAQDFVIAIELDAYDQETAYRVAGHRLARLVNRHLIYIQHLRIDAGVPQLYVELETIARKFLAGSKAKGLEATPDIASSPHPIIAP